MQTIKRARGGSKEREVKVEDIRIPDLWKIIHNHDVDIPAKYKKEILECWALAHDLLWAVKDTNK